MATREAGKSPFPLARVQRIIKADKEMGTVTRESVVLVALATEQFLRRFAVECSRVAVKENRTMVRDQDVGVVVRRDEEFQFLHDVLFTAPRPPPKGLITKRPKPGYVEVDDEEDTAQPSEVVMEEQEEEEEEEEQQPEFEDTRHDVHVHHSESDVDED